MKKLQISLLLILMLSILTIPTDAYTLIYTRGLPDYSTTISGQFINLESQLIVRIPFTAIPNAATITGYATYTGCFPFAGTQKPILPMHIRTYVYLYDNPRPNDYYLQENVNIYNNTCHDYGEPTVITYTTPIDVQSYNGTNVKGIAFGFYTEDIYNNDSYANWRFPYSQTLDERSKLYDMWTHTSLSYAATATNVYNMPVYDYYSSADLIYSGDMKIYGQWKFPPTPLPTPSSTGTLPLPCTDCDGTTLPGPSGNKDNYIPDWSNLTYCPECLGNETILVPGEISTTTGFCSTLIVLGYGSTHGCTSVDFIDASYDLSNAFFYISLILLLYKIYILYTEDNNRNRRH